MGKPVIEPTEMVQAFNDADFSGCGNADWEDSHVRVGMAAVLALVERETVRPMLELILDLTDRDECWFDHHGGCQAHGYLSLEPGEKCPHAQAKELLAANDMEV